MRYVGARHRRLVLPSSQEGQQAFIWNTPCFQLLLLSFSIFLPQKKGLKRFILLRNWKGFSVRFLRISLSFSLMELNFIYKHWVWLAGVVAGFLFLGMDLC